MWRPEQLVRSHLRKGFSPQLWYHDVQVLKRVLHDWVQAMESMPLMEKQSLPATLCVEVRQSHSSCGTAPATTLASSGCVPRPPTLPSRFFAQSGPPASSVSTGAAATSPVFGYDVHYHRTPMRLWPALLPWEIQRGLSQSVLPDNRTPTRGDPVHGDAVEDSSSSPSADTGHAGERKSERCSVPAHSSSCRAAASVKASKEQEVEENAEEADNDPFAVPFHQAFPSPTSALNDVGSVGLGQPPIPHSSSNPPAPSRSGSCTFAEDRSEEVHVAGMLFVLDVPSVRQQQGVVRFWSGAIPHSIDVLFFRPTSKALLRASRVSASALNVDSEALRRLEEEDWRDRMRAGEGNLSLDVAKAFFPAGDLDFTHLPRRTEATDHSAAESCSWSGTNVLQLHHAGHLDPFQTSPSAAADATTSTTEEEERASPCHHVSAQCEKPPYAHYVLECQRHTLRDVVQRAVRAARRATTGSSPAVPPDDSEASMDVTVSLHLSSQLEEELLARAQLYVYYVAELQQAMEHHMREQSVPTPVHHHEDVEASSWNSAHEKGAKPWTAADADDPVRVDEASDEAAYGSSKEDHDDSEEEEGEPEAALVRQGPLESSSLTRTSSPTHPSVPAARSSSAAVRRVEDLSPTLWDEAEGRPDRLAPSFFLLPPSSATTSAPAIVRSARERSRYPLTQVPPSSPPPPVDYELIAYAFRLGIGLDSVRRYYYERMLMDWQREVLRVRQGKKRQRVLEAENKAGVLGTLCRGLGVCSSTDGRSTAEPDAHPVSASALTDNDVCLMWRLVKDPSLQFPEELGALVEVVAEDRGISHNE